MTKLFLTVAAAAIMFTGPSFADNHGMEGHSDAAVTTDVVVEETVTTESTTVCTETNDAGEEVTVECAVETEMMHDDADHADHADDATQE